VPTRIDGNACGVGELPVPGARGPPLGEKGPRVRERLDAVVDPIDDEDLPAAIDGNPIGAGELTIAAARNPRPTRGGAGLDRRHAVLHCPAEGEQEGAAGRELLDAVVAQLADEDVPAPIDGNASGVIELPVPAAQAAPFADHWAWPGQRAGARCR